eukprot:IDg5054t1
MSSSSRKKPSGSSSSDPNSRTRFCGYCGKKYTGGNTRTYDDHVANCQNKYSPQKAKPKPKP